MVCKILAQLLHAPVQISYLRLDFYQGLSVGQGDHPESAVHGRMRWAYIYSYVVTCFVTGLRSGILIHLHFS
ncbi:hypothetical protein ES703_112524 [subsurface metagenome]